MSLYKKPNSPYYWYDVTIDGHRKRGSTKEVNKRLAALVESSIVNNAGCFTSSASTASTASITLGRCLDAHKEPLWATAKSYRGFYCILIRAIHSDSISDMAIKNLSTQALLDWQAAKLEYGNARSTLNQKLGIIRQCLNREHLVNNTVIPNIAWDSIKLKKAAHSHDVHYDEQTENRIQNYMREHGHYDIADLFIVLVDTGARFSNVSSLMWADIDMNSRVITYRATKNGTTIRIPMTNRVHTVLSNRSAMASPFASIEYNRVRLAWDRMRLAFGWKSRAGYKIHAFRHTCGTRLAALGVDIKTIQEWLGHKNINQTAKYVQVVNSSLSAARDKLDVTN